MANQIQGPGRPVTRSMRPLAFHVALVAAAGVLVGRLLHLQVVRHETYTAQAYENRITRMSEAAPRGIIYDRHGVILARNVPSFSIVITPADLPDNPARVETIYRELQALLKVPVTVPGSTPVAPCSPGRGIRDLVDEGAGYAPFTPVKIKCDISKTLALEIREKITYWPGVGVVVEPLREYPTGALTAALVGYLAPIPAPEEAPLTYEYHTARGFIPGRDRIGVAGIEATMQDELAGQNGSRLVEEDVAGQLLRTLQVETETVPGLNVQLTIDARLQAAAEAALVGRLNRMNNYLDRVVSASGVAIAMAPQTGEILAMVSWPTYDNNRFARGIEYEYYQQLAGDPLYPLLNHAVQSLYPPGSTFKIVTAAGVLEEGVIDPERELFDPGKITIRNAYYPSDLGQAKDFVCWKRDGHGWVNFTRAIAVSCNVYFYKVGGGYEDDNLAGLGIEKLGKWMSVFGFGERTGVELPGELGGFIPSRDWKRITWGESWSTGDTYNAAVGQGYVVATPLQMLNAYNAVINGGVLYQPTLIEKVLDGQGEVVTETQPILLQRLTVAEDTRGLLQEGLRQTVLEGTLADDINVFGEIGVPIVDVPGVEVAGKTGTAEYCDEIAYANKLCIAGQWPQHAWTVLYAPAANPKISVLVFVYNGGEGSRVAGPIASTILRTYFELKELDTAHAVSPTP